VVKKCVGVLFIAKQYCILPTLLVHEVVIIKREANYFGVYNEKTKSEIIPNITAVLNFRAVVCTNIVPHLLKSNVLYRT